ncbi:ankyrin-3-like isoform X1 [Stegodyphus dumicola]|uniref:ankyrin-3-like isoform X1 n=1 Tax=Stegodyphus dumicola TaxID=202533 RepID=UPI0015AFF5F0|nr:ankyrin-3-like isoform X1 [Stegodyphus dumicola]
MDATISVPMRKWEIELFFEFPPLQSPVAMDVLESLQKDQRSKRPMRRLADYIIHRATSDYVYDVMQEEDLISQINDPITKGLRLLHYAAYQNDPELLHLLLELGADPNVMDEVGFTPLHICAEKGYTDLILMLIQYGARVRFTELNPNDKAYGNPPRATAADEPLRLALRNGEHDTANLLLEHGANPSALYYLGHEINLVDPMDLESLELLLTYGADPNARDLQGLTPLMKACRNPQAVEAVHLLLSYGADVNAITSEDQRTSLHYAVIAGNLEVVEILIRHGANVCFPFELTRPPPLYFAVLRGSVEILEFLLNSGADINAVSTVVGSALHLALTEKIVNQLEVVKTLLRRGANPNAITVSDNRPVLKPPIGEYLQCCEHPQPEIIRLLLR